MKKRKADSKGGTSVATEPSVQSSRALETTTPGASLPSGLEADGVSADIPKGADGLPMYNGKPVTIARDVWSFYMTPDVYGVRHERIRNYLMVQDTFRLAKAIGKPLTYEDLEILVQLDGDQVLCAGAELEGKEKLFQPMKWVVVTKALIAELEKGKSLEKLSSDDKLLYVGHFFYRGDQKGGKIFAYSGTPFRWKEGYDEDIMSKTNPLAIAYHANGNRWPMIRSQAERLQLDDQKRRDGLATMQTGIAAQLGGWRSRRH